MGKVIALAGTKAGFDSIAFGVNLALSIAVQSGEKAVLLDLSFSGEDAIELLLGSKPEKSIADVLSVLQHADENLVRGYLPVHSSNVVFPKGFSPDDRSLVTGQQMTRLIRLIASAYPRAIVILPPEWDKDMAALLDASDILIFTFMSHLLSMTEAKGFLRSFKSWHYPLNMLKLVEYAVQAKHPLDKKSIEEYFGMEVFAELPYEEETIISSINSGKPLVLAESRGAMAVQINKLAKRLSDPAMFENIDRSSKTPQPSGTAQNRRTDHGALKEKLHKQLIMELNVRNIDLQNSGNPDKMAATREMTRTAIREILAKDDTDMTREERARFVDELLDDVLGLGCLEQLLQDPAVTEIMVNGKDTIYVEKKGKITLTGLRFSSDTHLRTVIDRIVSPLGRRIDEASPLVDARLADGSRVNIIIPPLALNGATVTIRKFSKNKLTADDLVQFDALRPAMADFLRACVQLRKNIVVSGGTGSGKTTLLNIVSSFIPSDERICTIEDSAELKLPQEHVVRLESRPASLEGTGEISIRRLVINALRMRPDRIVVGECRGGETLDMLQAMNTGHDGSLTTIHANTPKDGVARITTMVMMAGMDLPEKAIREQVASAVHIIVQLSRLSDGSRKVVEIAEVRGMKDTALDIVPLFTYEQTGLKDGKVEGRFVSTGNIPSFIDEAGTHGLPLDKGMFTKGALQ